MTTQHIRRHVGRLTVALALAVVAGMGVTGSAATASPANPAGTMLGCTFPTFSLDHFGMTISALGYRFCGPFWDEPIPVTVTVQRFNGATGVWEAVASGFGEAYYPCTGTANRRYRIAQRPTVSLTANCS